MTVDDLYCVLWSNCAATAKVSLVDVDARLLEALAARAGAWVRLGAWSDGDVVRIPPFDAWRML